MARGWHPLLAVKALEPSAIDLASTGEYQALGGTGEVPALAAAGPGTPPDHWIARAASHSS